MRRIRTLLACAALVATIGPIAIGGEPDQPDLAWLVQSNVIWDSPSKDSFGSMPLGNGDVGLNVWAEEGGDLLFYISKADAFDANHVNRKLGRVRVSLKPNPFAAGLPFRQTLDLPNARILVRAGKPGEAVSLVVWVDANHPVVHVHRPERCADRGKSQRGVDSPATAGGKHGVGLRSARPAGRDISR